MGYEFHLDSALVKPTQERWLKLQDFILHLKSKHVFDCKIFDVSYWVASLNRENGPRGTTSHEALSVSPQGALEISSTTGQPPSLDRSHLCTPGLVAESCKRDERLTPSSQDHSMQLLTDASNEGWGAHLEPSSIQGLWSPQEKRLHINVLELKAAFLALRRFKDQCQEQTVLVATDNSTVVAYINKQGGTHSAEMCALGPIRHLSEPQPSTVRVSYPRPEGLAHRCSKHKLDGSHCLCSPSTGSPSQGDPKNQTMQLSDHTNSPRLARDALVLGPSAALNRDPTAAPGVDNTPQAVPQLRVPQQPQHLNLHSWCLGVDNSRTRLLCGSGRENCCTSAVINKDHLQIKWPYLKNGTEKIR